MRRTRYQGGSIQIENRKHGPSVWVFRWWDSGSGKRTRRTRVIGSVEKYPTEAHAAKAAGHLRLQANVEAPVSAAVTFDAVTQRYLAEELPSRKSTGMFYRPWINNHILPKWKDYPVNGIKSLAVELWLKDLHSIEDPKGPLSPKSKGHIRSLMKIVFDCAIRWELTDHNPIWENGRHLVRVYGISKRKRDRRTLSIEECQKLLEALEQPWRTLALVAMCFGLRINEVIALKWSDFNWDDLRVKIERGIVLSEETDTKTDGSSRDLPMDPLLAETLFEFERQRKIPGVDWMFPNPVSLRPWHYNWALRKLVKAAEASGLGKVGWHDFRHTYSQLLANLGTDVKVHQGLLRHADFRTSMNVYTRRVKSGEREAHGKVVKMVIGL